MHAARVRAAVLERRAHRLDQPGRDGRRAAPHLADYPAHGATPSRARHATGRRAGQGGAGARPERRPDGRRGARRDAAHAGDEEEEIADLPVGEHVVEDARHRERDEARHRRQPDPAPLLGRGRAAPRGWARRMAENIMKTYAARPTKPDGHELDEVLVVEDPVVVRLRRRDRAVAATGERVGGEVRRDRLVVGGAADGGAGAEEAVR